MPGPALPREPVKITGGSGPDPLAREVGAAKAKDMQRDDVRRTMAPPAKELPVERQRGALPGQPGMGLQSRRDKARPSRRTRKVGAGDDGDDGDDGGDANEGQQPWVVLVAEDALFTVEAKREELKRSRLALVEACGEVRITDMRRKGMSPYFFYTRPCATDGWNSVW